MQFTRRRKLGKMHALAGQEAWLLQQAEEPGLSSKLLPAAHSFEVFQCFFELSQHKVGITTPVVTLQREASRGTFK